MRRTLAGLLWLVSISSQAQIQTAPQSHSTPGQLGINLLSTRSSPFFGKQTFTITELTASGPDPKLFELPADYKINDQRKHPPISQ